MPGTKGYGLPTLKIKDEDKSSRPSCNNSEMITPLLSVAPFFIIFIKQGCSMGQGFAKSSQFRIQSATLVFRRLTRMQLIIEPKVKLSYVRKSIPYMGADFAQSIISSLRINTCVFQAK